MPDYNGEAKVVFSLENVPEAKNLARFKSSKKMICSRCGTKKSLMAFSEPRNSKEILDSCGVCRRKIVEKNVVKMVLEIAKKEGLDE